MTADEWNAAYPVGTRVEFWYGMYEGPGEESVTRTPAWTLGCGDAVVSVEGRTGGIYLTHVQALP